MVIIGGGAAGFFAAIACAEANPSARVMVLERGSAFLSKVRISGGGRCNVTHHEYDPARLVRHYPRGGRALRGPLTRFGPRETVTWFEDRGVALKVESDGRMFPVSDDSDTVVAGLVAAARDAGVELRARAAVTGLDGQGARPAFLVQLRGGEGVRADRLLLATGSAPAGHGWAADVGHRVEPPVPSLFTFELADERLAGLAGVSVPWARVALDGTKLVQEGPLLVTHWGLSGPAVLKLSAWGARELHDLGYDAGLTIDFAPALAAEEVRARMQAAKREDARKAVLTAGPLPLPARLWRSLARAAGVTEGTRWADLSKRHLAALVQEVHAGRYRMTGKGVFKEEFVTCGGVRLDEVHFSTMESRVRPGLFLAGEILDIDGVTGGFNFQSAWTTGWLAGRAMAHDRAVRPSPLRTGT